MYLFHASSTFILTLRTLFEILFVKRKIDGYHCFGLIWKQMLFITTRLLSKHEGIDMLVVGWPAFCSCLFFSANIQGRKKKCLVLSCYNSTEEWRLSLELELVSWRRICTHKTFVLHLFVDRIGKGLRFVVCSTRFFCRGKRPWRIRQRWWNQSPPCWFSCQWNHSKRFALHDMLITCL